MNKNGKIQNIYLINLIKFKNKGNIQPINIEKEFKHKDSFLRNQLTCLAHKSLYMQELERLTKLQREKNRKQNIKIEIKKKPNKEYLNQRFKKLKNSGNKMILDLIFNNPKIKTKFLSYNKSIFSNDTKGDRYKLKLKIENSTSVPLMNLNYKTCHTDSINILSNLNCRKKFHRPLKFFTPNKHNLFLKKRFSIIKSLNNEEKNNIYNSRDDLKLSKYSDIDDEIKGMISINYNIVKNKANNNTQRYNSYYKYKD